jgi:carnosine synthase
MRDFRKYPIGRAALHALALFVALPASAVTKVVVVLPAATGNYATSITGTLGAGGGVPSSTVNTLALGLTPVQNEPAILSPVTALAPRALVPTAPQAELTGSLVAAQTLSARIASAPGQQPNSEATAESLGEFFDQFWHPDGPLKEVATPAGLDTIEPAPHTGLLPYSKLAYAIYRSKPGSEAVQYERLAINLEKLGHPPYIKIRRDDPVDPKRPTAAWLVNASIYKLAIAREGGKRSPGDWHLALDPSWFFQVTGDGKTIPLEFDVQGRPIGDGKTRTFLRKGLYFDEKGQSYLVEYKYPRPVRYDAQFFTMAANSRTDGLPLERAHEGPRSASEELLSIFKEKMHTRMIAAEVGEGVPASVGFLMPNNPVMAHMAEFESLHAARLLAMPDDAAVIRRELSAFLQRNTSREVVIKPSSSYFRSSRGVEFFDTSLPGVLEEMVSYVLALKHDEHMSAEGAVLVDERIEPPAVYYRTEPYTGKRMFAELRGELVDIVPLTRAEIKALPKDSPLRKDWNLRLFVARTPSGGAKSMQFFVRAGAWGWPTTAEPEKHPERAAAIVKLEDMLTMLRFQHGLLKTKAEVRDFRRSLERMGEKMLLGIAKREAEHLPTPGEPTDARMDLIGLDLMISAKDGALVPKLIEVNGHDSGGQTQTDRFYPDRIGAHSTELIETGFARARRDALKGMRIVVVGDGYEEKRFFLEKAKALGVKVILVAASSSWAKEYASEHIAVDTTKPGAVQEALAALRLSQRDNGPIQGVTSYWESDVALAAEIAAAFGLPFHSVEGVEAMRNKAKGGELQRKNGFHVARQASVPQPRKGDPKDHTRALRDLKRAMKNVGYPAVIKLDYGAAAVGMRVVDNWPEAVAAYERLLRLTAAENNNHHYGYDVSIWQYIDGKEFDFDASRQNGRTMWGRPTDNWPIRRPLTLATGSSSPSRVLTSRDERKIRAVLERSMALYGADNGVVHFEGTIDAAGNVYIFDPNARPGGHYVVRWVKEVWGRDLVEDMFMIAAGIPIGSYEARAPQAYLEGAFIRPDETGRIKSFHLSEAGLRHPGFIELERFKKPGQRYIGGLDGTQRLGMLQVKGDTPQEAQLNLAEILKHLIVEIEPDPAGAQQ